MRRRRGWQVGLVMGVAVVACWLMVRHDSGLEHATVNPPSYQRTTQTYGYERHRGVVTASASWATTDRNLREVFWDPSTSFAADQQSCISFVSDEGLSNPSTQPGLALRIAPSVSERPGIRAITIEQNVYDGVPWLFWVHTWDSGNPIYAPFTESFSMRRALVAHGRLLPAPWHLCAQTRGVHLRFKIWAGSQPEPHWGDGIHAHGVDLPRAWAHAGYSGGYIAHLRPGHSMTFAAVVSEPLCESTDAEPTPRCASAGGWGRESPPPITSVPGTLEVPPVDPDQLGSRTG